MKKYFIYIFILIYPCIGFSQSYDSIANLHYKIGENPVNFTDSLGLKQGIWIEYRIFKRIEIEYSDGNQQYYTSIRKLGQGYYKNNKKSGSLEYYRYYLYENIGTENYFDYGRMKECIYEINVDNKYYGYAK